MRVEDVAAPQSLAEAIAFMKRRPQAMPWAGGTLIMTKGDRSGDDRPVSILDLHGIPELTAVHRSDRFLELGACVTLSTILSLPDSLALDPLREGIRSIATASVRNLATIGGNVSAHDFFMTCFSALACMDAAVELRDTTGARWAGIHTLIGEDGRPAFPVSTIMTRIRIPSLHWDFATIRRLGEQTRGEPCPASFSAAARVEKGTIMELRLVAAGRTIVRDRSLELSLIGQRLPLTPKLIETAEAAASVMARERELDAVRADRYGSAVAAFLYDMQGQSR
ncbi:MAG TPA: FAD binding domain-containing protein [bacterium]|nr:FAD binding domain-containing protein [bacterium]